MTDTYAVALKTTLAAVWGMEGYKTWVESIPPAIAPLTPQQTALLKAAINLLNWNAPRLAAFLKDHFAIATIEDLPAEKIDTLFDGLHMAIAKWQANALPGKPAASISSLSCKYWACRLELYPEGMPARPPKRKKWILDGYQPRPPEPETPEPKPEKPEGDPPEPDDWQRFEFADDLEWWYIKAA